MGSLCKKVLKYGLVAFGTYIGIKAYSFGKSTMRISKTLPEFIKNLYGDAPKYSMSVRNNLFTINLNIKLGFSKEIIEQNDDIEETVTEYIQDFYPVLSKAKIDVEVYELESQEEAVNTEPNESQDNLSEEKEEITDEEVNDASENLSEEKVADSADKEDEE